MRRMSGPICQIARRGTHLGSIVPLVLFPLRALSSQYVFIWHGKTMPDISMMKSERPERPCYSGIQEWGTFSKRTPSLCGRDNWRLAAAPFPLKSTLLSFLALLIPPLILSRVEAHYPLLKAASPSRSTALYLPLLSCSASPSPPA